MTVLITGATGFVGTNLMDYLNKSGVSFDTLSKIELNEGDFSKLQKSKTVVHLAGKAHDHKHVSNPGPYYEINYDLTRMLFDAFCRSECEKFIFISSVKASADTVVGPLTEEHFPDPATDYGKSKLMAEQYIMSQPLSKGKFVYILRPCMIHGPGNKGNLNLLYKMISKGVPYPLADFDNRRSFLSIENLCFIIREILTRSDIPAGTYNASDDDGISTNELVLIISRSLGRKPRLLRLNAAMVKSIAKLGDFLHLPLTTERLEKLTESYLVSNLKIINALGKDLPVKVRQGIVATITSFR